MPTSQFKGLSISERKTLRRQKLIQAGIDCYGQFGFFAVTVKDICVAAGLTERYFYESFKKSDELFQAIFVELISELQNNVIQAIEYSQAPEHMLRAGLSAFLSTLQSNPAMARIIYVDAMLVQELHQQANIRQTMQRFESIVQRLLRALQPDFDFNEREFSWLATGINGYVTHIAIRWVMTDFKADLNDVLNSCELGFRQFSHQPNRI